MAQRLDVWMRARVEVLSRQGLPNAEIGECLGRSTLVERKSRQTLVVGLGDGYNAKNTAKAVTQALARQPSYMVKTLTSQNHT